MLVYTKICGSLSAGTFFGISYTYFSVCTYSKTCVKRQLSKRPKIDFQDQLSLNAGQKYCRMLKWEHSAILSTFIKLPFVIKRFVLSFYEWPFYTGITVCRILRGTTIK